ncbi:hypothetical protein [Nocardia sp. NPDC020380]|uniref:hypothetical protein n=1 Tax=Nocardia sp. NPDC020380 TaxID=3364309 RepID=UPI0037921454
MLGLVILVFAGPIASQSISVVMVVALGLVLLGWGIGAVFPHLLTDVLRLAGDRDQDLAGASATTVQLTATAFGSALAGTIANLGSFSDSAHTASAARWLYLIFLVPAVLAAPVARLVRR